MYLNCLIDYLTHEPSEVLSSSPSPARDHIYPPPSRVTRHNQPFFILPYKKSRQLGFRELDRCFITVIVSPLMQTYSLSNNPTNYHQPSPLSSLPNPSLQTYDWHDENHFEMYCFLSLDRLEICPSLTPLSRIFNRFYRNWLSRLQIS
jgi:hypothetical protein